MEYAEFTNIYTNIQLWASAINIIITKINRKIQFVFEDFVVNLLKKNSYFEATSRVDEDDEEDGEVVEEANGEVTNKPAAPWFK